MEATSQCPHVRRTVFNGWELLRKYECEDCCAIATCPCDKSIAQYVLPHQAMTTQDPESNQRVPVTDPHWRRTYATHAGRSDRRPSLRAARTAEPQRWSTANYWRETHEQEQDASSMARHAPGDREPADLRVPLGQQGDQ